MAVFELDERRQRRRDFVSRPERAGCEGRIAVRLRDAAAGRQLGVAEYVALDESGEPELQFADVFLHAERAGESLLDRLLERADDGRWRRCRFRPNLVVERSQRLPVTAEIMLMRGDHAAALFVDLLARDRLAKVAERIDGRRVAVIVGD